MPQTIKGQPIDQKTAALNLPLPHLDNWQDDDVPRLRGALVLLDFIIAALQAEKAGAADLNALAGELRNALGLKAGAKELQDTAAELRNTLGLKAAAKDLQDIAAELRNALGLKADANGVVKSWAGRRGDIAPVFADLGGRPDSLAGYGIQNFRAGEGLAENVHLATVVTSGIYRYNTAADNPPGVLYSPLLVFRSVDTCAQMLVDYYSGAMFVRSGVIINGVLTDATTRVGAATWRRVAYQNDRAVATDGVMDLSLGTRFILGVGSMVALSFTNVPAGAVSVVLEINYAAGGFSLPAGSIWANGRVPEIAAGKRHLFFFEKCIAGYTAGWYVSAITGYIA
ncbi:pyocin knob domain-containing protein [Acidovorax sp. PRC11]|uniref:pyocin knob domain-containing protein n=1 Tax=Acidovorax sp. PRC11 TaxID=2962592 RepID=UPI0028816C34|nr:pyocin knob domain-containing protein [Acidovorax sp. PRC11]MDT0137281.1 pyocin knob domain-containing protein [Acidovorax sp. PRC11]